MALYTQQHYPDFTAEIQVPEPTPQPMTVAPAAPVVADVTTVAPRRRMGNSDRGILDYLLKFWPPF